MVNHGRHNVTCFAEKHGDPIDLFRVLLEQVTYVLLQFWIWNPDATSTRCQKYPLDAFQDLVVQANFVYIFVTTIPIELFHNTSFHHSRAQSDNDSTDQLSTSFDENRVILRRGTVGAGLKQLNKRGSRHSDGSRPRSLPEDIAETITGNVLPTIALSIMQSF